MTEIDYLHDSLAEITLKQKEIIEQQAARILCFLSENYALREDPKAVITSEHERLEEAVLLTEGWIFRQLRSGEEWMSARAMYRVLMECLDYADTATVPPWFEAAKQSRRSEETNKDE